MKSLRGLIQNEIFWIKYFVYKGKKIKINIFYIIKNNKITHSISNEEKQLTIKIKLQQCQCNNKTENTMLIKIY